MIVSTDQIRSVATSQHGDHAVLAIDPTGQVEITHADIAHERGSVVLCDAATAREFAAHEAEEIEVAVMEAAQKLGIKLSQWSGRCQVQRITDVEVERGVYSKKVVGPDDVGRLVVEVWGEFDSFAADLEEAKATIGRIVRLPGAWVSLDEPRPDMADGGDLWKARFPAGDRWVQESRRARQ